MTEDEQLEWAIKESSRTYGFETPEPLNSSESKRKHRVKITPDLLETNEALALDSEGFVSNTSIFKGDNESENNKSFTRLRTPNEKTEADIIETSDKDHDLLHCDTQNQNKEANEGHAMNWFSNTDKDHGKDNSMYSAAVSYLC